MADAHRLLGTGGPVSVTVPRLLGVIAATWAWRGVLWGPVAWSSAAAWIVATSLCAVAAASLMLGRWIRWGAAALTGACVTEMLARPMVDNEPAILLGWVGAILLLTEGEPRERAFLLRVCTSSVYVFAALSKVNPEWLAGHGVFGMSAARVWLGTAAAAFPLTVLLLECAIGAGLWFRSARGVTAALGVCLHTAIVVMVANSLPDVLYLLVLNFGLVAMYPSFWFPLRASDVCGRRTHSSQSAKDPSAVSASVPRRP